MLRTLLRSTFILYYALLIGQLVFCLVVIYLIQYYGPDPDRVQLAHPLLGLLVVLTTGFGAFYMNRMRTQQANRVRTTLEGKLLHYRTTVLLRSAIVEAGNFLALTLALLALGFTPLLFFALGLAIFYYFRPSRDEFLQTYKLTGDELMQLNQL